MDPFQIVNSFPVYPFEYITHHLQHLLPPLLLLLLWWWPQFQFLILLLLVLCRQRPLPTPTSLLCRKPMLLLPMWMWLVLLLLLPRRQQLTNFASSALVTCSLQVQEVGGGNWMGFVCVCQLIGGKNARFVNQRFCYYFACSFVFILFLLHVRRCLCMCARVCVCVCACLCESWCTVCLLLLLVTRTRVFSLAPARFHWLDQLPHAANGRCTCFR